MLTRFLLSLLFLVLIPSAATAAKEPLRPDVAFKASASQFDNSSLEATWEIADEYYLYKDKFRFSSDTPGVTLGDIEMPAGKVKEDPLFGKVEIYRDEVKINVPVRFDDGIAKDIDLKVTHQGCADMGICYPPQKKIYNVPFDAPNTSAPASNSSPAGGLNLLADLNNDLGGGDDELLPPDQAFAFSSRLEGSNTLVTEWLIADKYYLYKDKIKPEISTEGITLGAGQYPPSTTHADPAFGSVEIYRGPLTIKYPLQGDLSAVDAVQLTGKFQGCADLGVCYPPIKKEVSLPTNQLNASEAPMAAAAPAKATSTQAAPTAATAEEKVSEQDAIANSLAGGNTALTLLSFFGAGLLLAFTPCVFPMIPILSGIIIGDGATITTRKALMLSIAYVLAMALTYTLVGVLAGLFGANIQVWFQNPWILGTFAALFVGLSLSMFGFYELQMPASIQSKLVNVSNNQEGGKLLSAAIMGVLSALIVGPCVTAPLIGALIYIGQTGDAVLGGLALFALGMGMGAPLIAIGASAGKLLPKAGMWMESVKAVFGVLMLGLAIWLLERILPLSATLALSSVLLIGSAVYMGAISQIPEEKSGWYTLWKGLGLAMLLYGAIMMVGATSGATHFFTPLKGIFGGGGAGTSVVSNQHLNFKQIKGLSGLQAELDKAKANGQTVMLDFYADWCVSCKEMEALVFTDATVISTLKDTVLLQADVTPNDAEDQALMKNFGLFGPPAILYFGANSQEHKGYRIVGFTPAAEFAAHSQTALSQ